MRAQRWWLTVLGSLGPLLLGFVWLEVQLSRASHEGESSSPRDERAIVFHHHVERIRTRSGEISWQFEAAQVTVLESGDYLIEDLEHGQYFSHGVSEVDFRADRAQFEARSQNVAAAGHVRVVSHRGLSFEADAVYWFELEGKLVVPKVRRLEWTAPEVASAAPAEVTTGRLFLWPRSGRVELPDAVSARHQGNTLEAASATVQLDSGRLDLVGPAKLAVVAPLEAGAKSPGGLEKRLVVSVAQGGQMAYNARSGGAMLSGRVHASIPADRVDVDAQRAVYDSAAQRLQASGDLLLRDPANELHAPRVVIATHERRADFAGPVHLTHRGSEAPGGTTGIDAPNLSFWYAEGARRAEADGGVRLTASDGTATAQRIAVDLEAESALLSGGVRLSIRPRGQPPPGADELERAHYQPITVTCARLRHVFTAGAERSEADGSPRFVQADRHGTAKRMGYDHEGQILTLDGEVRLWNKAGEWARCARLSYDVGRDELTVQTPAKAQILLSEGE